MSSTSTKALKTKAERKALSDLDETLGIELPGATKELLDFWKQLEVDESSLLTILATGVVPSQIQTYFYGAYSDFWRDRLWEWVGDVAKAGQRYTGLSLDESLDGEYLRERGPEWAKLMIASQVAAYREVRSASQEMAQEDALELMRLATGLAASDARYLARAHASTVEDIRKALGATLLRNATNLLRGRANRTAESELTRAYNTVKVRAWSLAERLGLVRQATKTWVAAEEPGPDSRVCPLCTKLHRKSVPVNEDFEENVSGPPRHPRCRCTVVMKEKG